MNISLKIIICMLSIFGSCLKWIQWVTIWTDVLLLAVFEKFIEMCLKYYGLDPCHYFSSPGLSWDAMLQMTRIKLELLSDIGMYLFVEKGMTEGISYITKRYSKTNDKYMK